MPGSLALILFNRLVDQVSQIEVVAAQMEANSNDTTAPILRRSGYVLAVAAFDSYFHERGIELLAMHAKTGMDQAAEVSNFVQNVSSDLVAGDQGESYIRYRLSFKTLVSPSSIDGLLNAIGKNPTDIWMSVAFALNSRPDRIRRLLEIIYDRRNQIAHEADWDVARLEFRPMERAHLSDCVNHIRCLAEIFDSTI